MYLKAKKIKKSAKTVDLFFLICYIKNALEKVAQNLRICNYINKNVKF